MSEIFSDFIIEALETDSSYPGVFMKAQKPALFKERDLSKHNLYSVVKDRPVSSIRLLDFYKFRIMMAINRYVLNNGIFRK
jgi:hypothetical protein